MSSRATLQPIIEGHWLDKLCTWGDLEVVHGWPGDCIEASWTMTSRYKSHHPAFHRDAPVQVNFGMQPTWGGLLQEPEWNGRDAKITARGWWRAGEDYPAFTGGALATDNPRAAIDAQNARGLGWIPDASVPNVSVFGGDPDRGNLLSALMDGVAEHNGVEWGVNARRVAYFAPSTSHVTTWGLDGVDYQVRVGVGELSAAEDAFASHIQLWYLNDADVYGSVSWPPYAESGPTLGSAYERRWGHRDWLRDVTDLGNVPASAALDLAKSIYNRGLLRPSFSTGIDLFPGEIVNRGGVEVNVNRVKPNKVMRVHGVRDVVLGSPYTDFVIGKVTRKAGTRGVYVEPMGVASQTQDDMYQEALEAAAVAHG